MKKEKIKIRPKRLNSASFCPKAAGGVAGYFFGYSAAFNKEQDLLVKKINELHPIRLNNSYYKFINPILSYETPSASEDPQFAFLRNEISDFINAEKKKGLIKVSVYMSELNQGRWIGVDSNDMYAPASMYKVVVMVAYFSAEENTPGLSDEKYIYTKNIDEQAKNLGFDSLQVGQSYTVGDLINRMIIDSDNGAEALLSSHIDQNSLNSFLNLLNIKGAGPNGNFFISPKQYSLFFGILYNATYLNADSSEKALELLSQTTFNYGLVAGVPKNIVVAHKFGQYVGTGSDKIQGIQGEELHDCGIVYYPDNPYLLCVMTNGKDLDELESVIKNISSIVYQDVSK
ncbi:MAG: serine hydrolase [Candidatus Staskawiczbacteria bacterium]